MNDDNWKHRGTNMRCESCMYFVPKGDKVDNGSMMGVTFGRCRRRCPTINGFPAVYSTDWCGDHKMDEAKATVKFSKHEVEK